MENGLLTNLLNNKNMILKIVRFLGFIPVFFLVLLLARIVYKIIFYIFDLISLEFINPLWTEIVVSLFAIPTSIYASLHVYPLKNKKIPLFIIGSIIFLIVAFANYLVFVNPFEIEFSIFEKILTVIQCVIYIVCFTYITIELKEDSFEID